MIVLFVLTKLGIWTKFIEFILALALLLTLFIITFCVLGKLFIKLGPFILLMVLINFWLIAILFTIFGLLILVIVLVKFGLITIFFIMGLLIWALFIIFWLVTILFIFPFTKGFTLIKLLGLLRFVIVPFK